MAEPVVRCALFCEEIRVEADGRLSLISMLSHRIVKGDVPEDVGPIFRVGVAVFLLIECDPGDHHVTLAFGTPARFLKEQAGGEFRTVKAGESGLRVRLDFEFPDVTLADVGEWTLLVAMDGVPIATRPLQVSYRYVAPMAH